MKLYDVYDGTKYVGEMTIDQISELTEKKQEGRYQGQFIRPVCSMKDMRLCTMGGTQSANQIKTI